MTAQDSLPLGRDVAGVDEVGRGCLFGPVFAAAVVLESAAAQELLKAGLTDSKKLSAKRRAALVPVIQSLCAASGLGQASAREIDACGIRVATECAMLRALQRLPQRPGLVLVDGNLPLRLWQGPQRTVIAGGQPISGHCCGECSGQGGQGCTHPALIGSLPWLRP